MELAVDDSGLVVHTADTSYSTVDIFHAYCALAVVRHRLLDTRCMLNCCKDELTAREVAGLCRLLLWDIDICRRRWSEELLHIQHLQANLSDNSCNHDSLSRTTKQPANHQSTSQESGDSSTNDVSQDTVVADKCSLESLDEPTTKGTCITSDEHDGGDVTSAADVNSIDDVDRASPVPLQNSEWQTLPIDVKYSKYRLSAQLLEQEAARLSALCDSFNQCLVITYHYHVSQKFF